MMATKVEIKRVQVGLRHYDQIRVWFGDLMLSCDAANDRQVRQAMKLASDHGATFDCDEANASRVARIRQRAAARH